MPVYFSWKKDGMPIPMGLQVTEKKDEFFTLLVFKDITAKHSGMYTCFATNSAAKVNFTSEMLVKGNVVYGRGMNRKSINNLKSKLQFLQDG